MPPCSCHLWMAPRSFTHLDAPVTLVSLVAPPSGGIALELESPSAADWLNDFRKRNVRM